MPDGYTGADVYDRMHRFPGNEATLDSAKQAADALKSGHTELADRIRAIQTKLDSTWAGDTSAKAQAGLNPLIQTSTQASADLEKSAGSMSGQHSAFSGTRDKLVKIDGPRPDTDDLASYMPWGASDSEKKAAQWDTNDKNNKEAYGTYYATTDTYRNAAAKDYPVLNAAPAGIAVAPPSGPGNVQGFTGDTGTGGRGGRSKTGGGGHSTDYTGGQDAQQQQQPGTQPPSNVVQPPAASHQPPSTTPPTMPGQHPGTGPSDSTSTSGYEAPKPPVSSAPGFGSGLLPTFGPTGSGGGDSVSTGSGGFGSVGGIGSTPGGGGTGSVRGVGGMTGGTPGAGNGSGSGAAGERAGIARPGGAAGGAAGTKGAPGMGGMGQGAGKGKGGEDEEHQRKITLQEEDPDEIFGGVPDGMKPTPPVIGA